jgi:hypothetical protein
MENRKLRRELAAIQTEQASQLRREEELRQRIAQLLALTPTPIPITQPPPDRPAQPDDLIAINLSPASRDTAETQIVKLSTAVRRARLNLKLNFEPVALRCRVILQTPDGAKVERRNLRARPHPQGGFSVQADFTTLPLKAGTYEVIVTGRDADDNEQREVPYRFRVETSGRQ